MYNIVLETIGYETDRNIQLKYETTNEIFILSLYQEIDIRFRKFTELFYRNE